MAEREGRRRLVAWVALAALVLGFGVVFWLRSGPVDPYAQLARDLGSELGRSRAQAAMDAPPSAERVEALAGEIRDAIGKDDVCALARALRARNGVYDLPARRLLEIFFGDIGKPGGPEPRNLASFDLLLWSMLQPTHAGISRILDAQEEKKNVRFYRALFDAGLVEGVTLGGGRPGADGGAPEAVGRAKERLERLAADHPENAAYPLFVALLREMSGDSEASVVEALEQAVGARKFKTNQAKIAGALGRRGLESASRAVAADFVKDYLPSPDYGRAAELLVSRLPHASEAFSRAALDLGRKMLKANRAKLLKTQFPVAGMKREFDAGRWVVLEAWKRLHPDDPELRSAPEELRALVAEPLDAQRDFRWRVLLERLESSRPGECPREELERFLEEERRAFESLQGSKRGES